MFLHVEITDRPQVARLLLTYAKEGLTNQIWDIMEFNVADGFDWAVETFMEKQGSNMVFILMDKHNGEIVCSEDTAEEYLKLDFEAKVAAKDWEE